MFYSYGERIRAAGSCYEVERLIDKLGAEPAAVISSTDRESLKSLARGRYKDLKTASDPEDSQP